MKISTIRTFVLAVGVVVAAGFGPGIIGSTLSATATGNNTVTEAPSSGSSDTEDNTNSNPFNPSSSDDLVVSVDWSAASKDLSAAMTTDDRNVRVLAGTQYTIPTDVMSTLAQNKKVLMLHSGNNLAVSVSSEDVKTGSTLKMDITNSIDIPTDVKNSVSNIAESFAVKDDSVIPFKVDVHVTVGQKYAGKYAVLYRYKASTNTLVASGAFKVTEGGNAMFALHTSGQYVVAIADDMPQVTAGYVVGSGDTLSKIARKYGVSLNDLLKANPQITDANKIRVGQELNVW